MARPADVKALNIGPRFLRPQHSHRYPWDAWLNGKVWLLTEGEDYSNEQTLRSAAQQAAARRGLKVRVERLREGLHLQSFQEDR